MSRDRIFDALVADALDAAQEVTDWYWLHGTKDERSAPKVARLACALSALHEPGVSP